MTTSGFQSMVQGIGIEVKAEQALIERLKKEDQAKKEAEEKIRAASRRSWGF